MLTLQVLLAMPYTSLLSIAYRQFVNAEYCQEIKFKQYIRSWTCLFRALFIFAVRMISNRLAEGGMDYYHVGFSQQRGWGVGGVIVCFASFEVISDWQAAGLSLILIIKMHSYLMLFPKYSHTNSRHLKFLCRGKDNILCLRVQNEVS